MPSAEEIALANKAIRNGLITIEDARECFGFAAQQKSQGIAVGIEEVLIDRGYLSRAQLDLLRAGAPVASAPAEPAPPAEPSPEMPMARRDLEAEEPVEEVAPMAEDEVVEMTPMADSKPALAPIGKRPTPKAAPAPAPSPAAAKPPAGGPPKDPVPGYQIVGKVGAGGMATVFKAVRASTGETVALKILFPHHAKNALFLRRFRRESELLAQFQHENIVRGIDHGCVHGMLNYVVMEFLEGESLQDVLNRLGSLKEDQALAIILQIAKGLEYIEGQGIVHRDIKPDNVIITPSGVLKMIDLGFAKPIGQPEETAEDMTCGTPQYMSPEQAQGAKEVDVRSDIYSLGATLYHMALGEVPFKGTDNMEVMAAQVLNDLKSDQVKSGKISRHMHYFLEKLMAKDVDLRYQSPHEVIEDIEGLVAGYKSMQFSPEAAAPESAPAPARETEPASPPPKAKVPGKASGSFRFKGGSGVLRRGVPPADPKKKDKPGKDSGSGFNFWKPKR